MTARKPKTQTEPTEIAEPSHEAEHEQDVVGEAKPAERLSATLVAAWLAQSSGANLVGREGVIRVDGNRLTVVAEGSNGLVQTFHATVEEGIREF